MDETVGHKVPPPAAVTISRVNIDRVGEQVIHATVYFDLFAESGRALGPRVVTDHFQARIYVAGARNLDDVERRARRCLARFADQVVATMGTANARKCISGKPKLDLILMGDPQSPTASVVFSFLSCLPWVTSGEGMGEGSMDSVVFMDEVTVEVSRKGGLQDIGSGAQEGLKTYMEFLVAGI